MDEYDRIADWYATNRNPEVGMPDVAELAHALAPGARILDLGCGTGVPIARFLLHRGFEVFGVDSSAAMIERFRRTCPDAHAQHATIGGSDFFHTRFDAVIAWGVLLHLAPADQADAIARVSDALRPGGRFLLTAGEREGTVESEMGGVRFRYVSLGAPWYRQALHEYGFEVLDAHGDAWDNHVVVARKRPDPPAFRNLLYREPWLYDLVFPDAEGATARMLRTAIGRYLSAPPRSMLDVGCGTGRDLGTLADTIADRWGVDLLESNIAHAGSVRPGVTFRVGDMRTVRLGRTFDVVTCLGNALSYALTDEDLTATVTTLAAHAHPGTLLVTDPLNARAYLDPAVFRERVEARVEVPGFTATAVSVHRLHRDARLLERTRTWRIAGRADVEDHAAYRLLDPDEVRRLLDAVGFEVLDLHDNRELRPTALGGDTSAAPDVGGMRGRKLYVFARRR